MKLRWKWLLWVVIALGALVLLCVGRHYRAKAVVENYREKLRAQGGKMTVAELIPEMPADELNAGPDLLSAAARLYSMPSNYPPLMKGIAPGHALVGWAEETSPTRDSANIWPDFAQTMHERSEGLADIRAALKRPSLSFRVNYTQGYSVPIPHLPNLKKAVSWLSMETVLDLHENQPDKAWDNLCACARVVQLYKGEPLEISQLVRAAMSQIAISTSWEALQYPDWSEAQLAALQQIWGSFDLMDGLDSSMAMERAFNPDIFASCRNSFEETSSINSFSTPTNSGSTTISDLGEALANPRESLRSFMDRYPRYWAWKWWWSYEEELSMLQSSEAGLD
ncbi:MAG: hypothetical protein JWR26_2041, partial [Pedosphaera sp.]|nr:hypothetical protein [Pedosphaera sp.]